MNGLMMQQPLLISSLLVHAERHHGEQEIVSRRVEGDLHRSTYRQLAARSRRMAKALAGLGVKPGQTVATLAWNGYRHMELYYAVSGSGAVLHTLNPRLHPDQVVYIADHAEDQVLCFDMTFLPLVEAVAARLKTVKHFVAMTDRAHMPASSKIAGLLCYEELVEAQDDRFEWPQFDENSASSLCYTSGTTGNPKGALYSHRSTLLHTLAAATPDALNCRRGRHHPAGGADVPRQRLGPALCGLHGRRQAGVPRPGAGRQVACTSCSNPRRSRCRPACPRCGRACWPTSRPTSSKFSTMRRSVIGGSACPPAMISTFKEQLRRARAACLGHDRDEPAGHGRQLQVRACGADAGTAVRGDGQAGPCRSTAWT